MKTILLFLTFIVFVNVANAAVDIRKFESVKQEKRYKSLVNELRCLVCQNQNLADSNAPLAQDLRKKVYLMIIDGKSDQDIYDFMVTRYGDFVLYRPPLNPMTFILWVGPFVILVMGLYVLVRYIRQRKTIVVKDLSANDKEKLKKLFDQGKG